MPTPPVAGHQHGTSLVTPAEDLEQQFGPGGRQRHVAQLIDDQQPIASELPVQAQEAPLVSRFQQLMDQSR